MFAVYVVRDTSPSGVFATYNNRPAAEAAVKALGGEPNYPVPESGSWIVIATVQDTFNPLGPQGPLPPTKGTSEQ